MFFYHSSQTGVKVTLEMDQTPMLQSRKSLMLEGDLKKHKGEDNLALEKRLWRRKLHVNNDTGAVYIPGGYIQRTLETTQNSTAHPIAPAGTRKKSMKDMFRSGVVVKDTDLVSTITGEPIIASDELAKYEQLQKAKPEEYATKMQELQCHVMPFENALPGSMGLIPCIRPAISNWRAEVFVRLVNEAIKPEHVVECLEYAGLCIGFGDWRIERGGKFGSFKVTAWEALDEETIKAVTSEATS